MGAMELQPAGPGHPCKRMRLGGRQNNMPEEFCMASTCVLPPRSPRWRRTNVLPSVFEMDGTSSVADPPRASLPYPKTARAGNRAADARTKPARYRSARPTARYDADAVRVPSREDLSRDATPKGSASRASQSVFLLKPFSSRTPLKNLHSQGGDGAFRIVPHPRAGHVLVANFDIPRGYKTVFWGTRKTWKATEGKEGEDYAMCFRSNGGVIDPTTHKRGSQMQFMSNPGPNERQNMRSTNEFYGKTYEDGLVGREFVVMHDVKKNHQLLIWYGYSWFDARGIDRIDVGTKRYPATLRETKDEKDTKKAKKKSPVAKDAKPPLRDATNEREKMNAAA